MGFLTELHYIFWQATWGNNTAWLESLLLTGLTIFFVRDRLGKRFAAWWARHHHEHMVAAHLEALRRHEEEKRESQ